MKAIERLREIQSEEILNGFLNGDLHNDLEDLIYKLENKKSQNSEISETYGSRTMEQINNRRAASI